MENGFSKNENDSVSESEKLPTKNVQAPTSESELIPKTRENYAQAWAREIPTNDELDRLTKKDKIDGDRKNQNLARTIVWGLVIWFAVLTIVAGFYAIIYNNSWAQQIFKECFDLLKYSLFAGIGFLFGEKSLKK